MAIDINATSVEQIEAAKERAISQLRREIPKGRSLVVDLHVATQEMAACVREIKDILSQINSYSDENGSKSIDKEYHELLKKLDEKQKEREALEDKIKKLKAEINAYEAFLEKTKNSLLILQYVAEEKAKRHSSAGSSLSSVSFRRSFFSSTLSRSASGSALANSIAGRCESVSKECVGMWNIVVKEIQSLQHDDRQANVGDFER